MKAQIPFGPPTASPTLPLTSRSPVCQQPRPRQSSRIVGASALPLPRAFVPCFLSVLLLSACDDQGEILSSLPTPQLGLAYSVYVTPSSARLNVGETSTFTASAR